MHCCIPTPTTDSNTSTGMIWVTLNMPSAAEECREPSGNFTLSRKWSPCTEGACIVTREVRCGSPNILSASVRGFWPNICVRVWVHKQVLYWICCQSASAMIYIPSSNRYSLSTLSHGCFITLLVVCCVSMPCRHDTVSEITLTDLSKIIIFWRIWMRACPWIFVKKPSVSVRKSQEFLRICVSP